MKLFLIATSIFVSCVTVALSQQVEPLELKSGQHQLFLDDYLIERMEGLKHAMRQPEKRCLISNNCM